MLFFGLVHFYGIYPPKQRTSRQTCLLATIIDWLLLWSCAPLNFSVKSLSCFNHCVWAMHLWIGDFQFRTLVFTIDKHSNVIQRGTRPLFTTTSISARLQETLFCSKLTGTLGVHKRKHQGPPSLTFVMGIHWWSVDSSHKGPVTRKMFQFDDVIIN